MCINNYFQFMDESLIFFDIYKFIINQKNTFSIHDLDSSIFQIYFTILNALF